MKQMSGLKKFLITKVGIVTIVLGAYAYHTEMKKIDYNIFEKNHPVAEGFYKNPPILDVEWKANDEGLIETYLVNNETGKKVEIMYDMMPKNETMVQTLNERIGVPQQENQNEEVSEHVYETKPKTQTKLKSASMLEEMLGYFNNK